VKSAQGIIHACLNGDIDNYLELKRVEAKGKAYRKISPPTPRSSRCRSRNTCEGASTWQRPSGWPSTISRDPTPSPCTPTWPRAKFSWPSAAAARRFRGAGPDHYMPTSEVYGFIEETSAFVKMDGEKVVDGPPGDTQGQIFVLDQDPPADDRHHGHVLRRHPHHLTDENIKQLKSPPATSTARIFPTTFSRRSPKRPYRWKNPLKTAGKLTRQPSRTTMCISTNAAFPEKSPAPRLRRKQHPAHLLRRPGYRRRGGPGLRRHSQHLPGRSRHEDQRPEGLGAQRVSTGEGDGPTRA
jgi:glucosamine--fructose-6-phosphate aminotransferase (isomerizing)